MILWLYEPRQHGLKGTELAFALCIFLPWFSPNRRLPPVSVCALPWVSSKNVRSHSPARTELGRNWRPPTHQTQLCHEKTKETRIQMEYPFALCWTVDEHGKADLPRSLLSSNPDERRTRTAITARAGNAHISKPLMLLGRHRIAWGFRKKSPYSPPVFMKAWLCVCSSVGFLGVGLCVCVECYPLSQDAGESRQLAVI